jgi:hypothetical protein
MPLALLKLSTPNATGTAEAVDPRATGTDQAVDPNATGTAEAALNTEISVTIELNLCIVIHSDSLSKYLAC